MMSKRHGTQELHVLDATGDSPTELLIYSPDTDAIQRCAQIQVLTGSATTHQTIEEALGPAKTAALPSFHALTGADNTSSFSAKGKPKNLKRPMSHSLDPSQSGKR